MKINLGTFDVTDDQLIGIGLEREGKMVKSSREQAKELMTQRVNDFLEDVGKEVAAFRKQFLKDLKY